MRVLALMPLLVLAACTDSAEADQKAAEAAKDNLKLEAGQWVFATELTGIDALDDAPKPALKGAVGDKSEAGACIAANEVAQPQPAIFAGADLGECVYENLYMKRGRLSGTLGCKIDGLAGNIQVSLDGTYTATTLDVSARTQTYLSGDGDVAMTRKIVGKKVAGTCTPEKSEETPKA